MVKGHWMERLNMSLGLPPITERNRQNNLKQRLNEKWYFGLWKLLESFTYDREESIWTMLHSIWEAGLTYVSTSFSSNLAPHCFLCCWGKKCLSLSNVWIYTCPKFSRPGRGFRMSSGKWEELDYQQSRHWLGHMLTLMHWETHLLIGGNWWALLENNAQIWFCEIHILGLRLDVGKSK